MLTTIISAIVLAKGEIVRDGILLFARRLAGEQGYDAAIRAAQAIRAVVLGVVITAVVQASIGGAGLAITGIPAAPLLAAVMLFLCLAQLGPVPVLAPAVIWLYWSGQTGRGTVLLIIGLVAAAIDNILRPLLIRRGASLPLVLIFAGVIGGLIAFGIIGVFIGPVVLTVAYTLLAKWVGEEDGSVRQDIAADEPIARQSVPELSSCPPPPLRSVRQYEQVETGEEQKRERRQRRVGDPRWWHPASPRQRDEVGNDGHREDDGHPPVDLPNPVIPVQLASS